MNNDLLQKHLNDPAWAEVIRLHSGLFDTQEERENFILDLAETDILLAVECKMSSVETESRMVDLLKSKIQINNTDDVCFVEKFMSIIEFRDWNALAKIFATQGIMKKKNKEKIKKNVLGVIPKIVFLECYKYCFSKIKDGQVNSWIMQVLFQLYNFNANEIQMIIEATPKRQYSKLNHLLRINKKYNRDIKVNNVYTCKVLIISHKRVFVKIENETRKASIYIGELTNQRLANIYDFECNSEKLHIGQKLKAKVISIDEKGRINLSLKQVK